MSTEDIGLGSPNRWYAAGFRMAMDYVINANLTIRILSPAYFLATKLEAYFSRGQQDPYASKDLEDIIFLIDYWLGLHDSIVSSDQSLRTYLAGSARQLRQHRNLTDVVLGHISGRHQEERTRCILHFIDNLITG